MTNILITSSSDKSRIENLLNKNIPSYRQAYSDRTAWLMACLSEFAYIKFNPLFGNKNSQWLIDKAVNILGDNTKSALLNLISVVGYDHEEERKKLENELATLKMCIEETFDNDGTQAILVSTEKFIALAFRGTEKGSIKDIKSDAKAERMQCETGGKIHSGFHEAFNKVALDIQNILDKNEFKDKPLFITGHSLGGALATIAAKKLSHKDGGIAACYTYGSPRVSNDEWLSGIKTPIYRVVNAADCVTMLPPGTEIIDLIRWICRLIPKIGKPISSWLLKFGGYLHAGDMRYMTNCARNQYGDVKLLYSVSTAYRIKGWCAKKRPWKKFLVDHSISIYRKKLMIIAEKKNQ